MSYKDPCAEDLDHRARLLIFKIGAFWVVFRSLWHVIELDIGSGTLAPMCCLCFLDSDKGSLLHSIPSTIAFLNTLQGSRAMDSPSFKQEFPKP